MDIEKSEAIIEAMLFSTGSVITVKDIMNAIELGVEDIDRIMQKMKSKYDLGILKNLGKVLGKNPLLWLFPFNPNYEGEGIKFE